MLFLIITLFALCIGIYTCTIMYVVIMTKSLKALMVGFNGRVAHNYRTAHAVHGVETFQHKERSVGLATHTHTHTAQYKSCCWFPYLGIFREGGLPSQRDWEQLSLLM